jgi:hypothetical protein
LTSHSPVPPKSTPSSTSSYQSFDQPFPHSSQAFGRQYPTTENQLGELVVEYARKKIHPGDRFLLVASGIMWAAVLVYACYLYFVGTVNYGKAAGIAWSRPGFILGGIFLAAWLGGMVLVWFNRKSTQVYQHGLVFWKPGKKEKAFRWREISGVSFAQDEWSFLTKKLVQVNAVLYPNQSKPFRLIRYCPKENLVELMTRLKANLYPQLEPELHQEFKHHKRLYFGPVSLSLDGFYVNQQFFNWNQLKKIEIENGFLMILPSDGMQIKIAVRRIPNLEILLPLTRLGSEKFLRYHSAEEGVNIDDR